MIDEFQYAKKLLPFIKIHVDKHKDPGAFWLIGSQMFHMMKQASESLADRVVIIPMQGLSNSEIQGLPGSRFTGDPQDWPDRLKAHQPMDLNSVYERIFRGSIPRVHSGDIDLELF